MWSAWTVTFTPPARMQPAANCGMCRPSVRTRGMFRLGILRVLMELFILRLYPTTRSAI